MQKDFRIHAALPLAALAFLLIGGSAFGGENGDASGARPDTVMGTGPSGIYRYYDKESDEWVSGVVSPPPSLQQNQEGQGAYPLIIAPEINFPTPGGQPPPRPEPRRGGQ